MSAWSLTPSVDGIVASLHSAPSGTAPAAPAVAGTAAVAARASRIARRVLMAAATQPARDFLLRALSAARSSAHTSISSVALGPSASTTLQPRRTSERRRPVSDSTVAVKRLHADGGGPAREPGDQVAADALALARRRRPRRRCRRPRGRSRRRTKRRDRDRRAAAVLGDERDVVAPVGRGEVGALAGREPRLGPVVALVARLRAERRVQRVDQGLVGGPEVADPRAAGLRWRGGCGGGRPWLWGGRRSNGRSNSCRRSNGRVIFCL